MKQDQRVDAGGAAIQSAGDTIINQGLTQEQLRQIIEAVAAQVPVYAAIAREIVEGRLIDFENRIIDRFKSEGNVEAFKDPDFQYLLGRAQHAFARLGDDDVATTLADLILERSKSTQRSRLSLTLNQAVEVASTLTINEFAELAFCFLFSRTRNTSVTNIPDFCRYLNKSIDPYIDDISKSDASYSYLEAQRCANKGVLHTKFRDLLVNTYPGLFFKGLTLGEFEARVPNLDVKNPMLITRSLHDQTKLQLNALNKDTWMGNAEMHKVAVATRNDAWNTAQNTLMSEEEIISTFIQHVPRIKDAFEVWSNTPIHSLQLTSVGVAIGHSYATKSGFKADLSIWIN
jgi:hypothetical protein